MVDAQPLSPKARLAIAQSTARINAYEGSVRASKTFNSLIDWVRFVRSAPPGQLLMTGRTERTVWTNLVEPLIPLLGVKNVLMKRGDGKVWICGREVHVVGANNEQASAKIQGRTLIGAYVDEAATLPESFFNMLYSRLSLRGARMWLTSNPDGPAHWLKKKWLDRWTYWLDRDGREHRRPVTDGDGGETGVIDLHRFTFVIDDNATLDPDYVASVKRSYTGLWYRRFIGAEWVAGEGAIYDMWDAAGDTGAPHVIPWASLPPIRRIFGVGIDYGTQHATVALMLGLGYDRNLYVVDELRLDSGKAGVGVQTQRFTDSEQSALLKQWIRTPNHLPEGNWLAPEWIIVDSAAASLREELSRDQPGHRMEALNTSGADKDVSYGIRLVASLLGQRRLRITDRCKSLIEELPSYSWDPKAAARGEEAPIKVADDAADALRYLICTLEVQWRDEMETTGSW